LDAVGADGDAVYAFAGMRAEHLCVSNNQVYRPPTAAALGRPPVKLSGQLALVAGRQFGRADLCGLWNRFDTAYVYFHGQRADLDADGIDLLSRDDLLIGHDTIFAGCAFFSGGGVFRSTDDG
jgi:hypothetical protein